MSMCYEVAVPQGKWPSFAAMNAALAAGGYPLKVLLQGEQQPDDPMQEFDGFLSFHVEFMGEFQEMEVYCAPYGPKGRDAEDTNEFFEELGSGHRVKDGDHNMNVGFSPSIPQNYFAPYCLLMGTLVRDFDGYGYEGQGPSFGRMDWAEELFANADATIEYEKRKKAEAEKEAQTPKVGTPTMAQPAAANTAPTPTKKGFPIWRTLAVIVVALLVAEFVDKNIYNFTGAGPVLGSASDADEAAQQ